MAKLRSQDEDLKIYESGFIYGLILSEVVPPEENIDHKRLERSAKSAYQNAGQNNAVCSEAAETGC